MRRNKNGKIIFKFSVKKYGTEESYCNGSDVYVLCKSRRNSTGLAFYPLYDESGRRSRANPS